MNKGKITKPFRDLGMMHALDQLKFAWQRWQMKQANQEFKAEYPGVKLPPDYLMFESFKLDYRAYFEGGRGTALWLIDEWRAFTEPEGKKILDWGCGPGRIIRHLPGLLPKAEFFGTDYNDQSITWCSSNIEGVSFSGNEVDPPLIYAPTSLDIAYGISIFTHLSEQKHQSWIKELHRVLRPGGLLLLTTQGKAFREKLTNLERGQFDDGRLVVRGRVKEGHRVFVAFQPVPYFKDLVAPYFVVKKHTPGEKKKWGIAQDVWILERLP